MLFDTAFMFNEKFGPSLPQQAKYQVLLKWCVIFFVTSEFVTPCRSVSSAAHGKCADRCHDGHLPQQVRTHVCDSTTDRSFISPRIKPRQALSAQNDDFRPLPHKQDL
jgi:hypothetical protein